MSNNKITKEKVTELIELYNSGKSVKECAEHFNVCRASIENHLHKKGVVFENRIKLPYEKVKKLHDLYINGMKLKELTKLCKKTPTAIFRYFKKYNLKRRKYGEASRKNKFNEDYFEKIDNSNKAYFLGLIVADGCVRRNGLIVGIVESDGYLLKGLAEEVKCTGNPLKIRKDHRKETYKTMLFLHLYSIKMFKDLAKYGVVPAKSFKTYFPDIPKEYWKDFIRGVIDGDGCISISRKGVVSLSICGNYDLIKGIKDRLISELCINERKIHIVRKSFCTLTISKQTDMKNIYNYIYKEDTKYFMERKKNKFKKLCE